MGAHNAYSSLGDASPFEGEEMACLGGDENSLFNTSENGLSSSGTFSPDRVPHRTVG